jgi:hypothetical protein
MLKLIWTFILETFVISWGFIKLTSLIGYNIVLKASFTMIVSRVKMLGQGPIYHLKQHSLSVSVFT